MSLASGPASASKSKTNKSAIGAPAQRTQASRKGKKAWRKNIDIDAVEEGLEEMRVEERVTGSTLQKKTDEELFSVDVKGDEKVRKNLPRFSTSLLSSARILAQRSAVPAVSTRMTSTNNLKRKKLTHEEKDRLLRIGKRMRKGPLNSVIDPTEVGAGSALMEVSEAVKNSGGYDVWGAEDDTDEDQEDIPVQKKVAIRKPTLPDFRSQIALSAVPSPHEGTSYNPPVDAHETLIRSATEIEERRVKEEQELAKNKERMESARRTAQEENMIGVASGMTVQELGDDDAEGDDDIEVPTKKVPARKTKQERRKAEKLRAEKRMLAEKMAQKRMLASVPAAKALRKQTLKTVREREAVLLEQYEKRMQEQLKNGLAGKRLGKHIVPEHNIDVQLGEDLSESLRQLKPEGNLFKDRFLSMQQRALIEPRSLVLSKRRSKVKEYEKYAWKRFERPT